MPKAVRYRAILCAIAAAIFGLLATPPASADPWPALNRAQLAIHFHSEAAIGSGKLFRFSYAGDGGERVPALLFLPPGASSKRPVPCIFALHGLGGSKETMAGFAVSAMRWGYATLAIDEYGQGERPRVLPQPGLAGLGELANGITLTVADARNGLDYLNDSPEINSRKIGLLGVSLGAIIGTIVVGEDTRIRAVALISGGGNWGAICENLADENIQIAGENLGPLRGTDWNSVEAQMSSVDPVTYAPLIAPRPMLMEAGRLDRIISPQSTEDLYKAATAPPNADVRLQWWPQYGHVPPPEATYPPIQAFFKKNL